MPSLRPKDIRHLLRGHSRTFGISIRLLPHAIRESLGIAYLLARASDTIADTGNIPSERRLFLLDELKAALTGDRLEYWQPEIHPGELSKSERELVRAVPELIAILQRSSDRHEVLDLLGTILKGQRSDLELFPSCDPLGRQELERYCGQVAGSVGETWTILIAKHAPRVLMRPQAEMQRLGFEYGQGLQLMNMLRDRAADRVLGRPYIDEKELPALLDLADYWLGSGKKYLSGLRPGRTLMATSLPHDLGVRTLREIRRSPEAARVKLSRSVTRSIVIGGLLSLCLPRRMNPAS